MFFFSNFKDFLSIFKDFPRIRWIFFTIFHEFEYFLFKEFPKIKFSDDLQNNFKDSYKLSPIVNFIFKYGVVLSV